MYEYEDNKRETLKSVFIKIVLVVLLIFVLMMLFPTKGFVTNYVDEKVKENSGSDNFNNNLLAMATAGSGYFTSSRLPKETGEKVKMTLGEMYDSKLLVRFSNVNNRTCNTKNSYLEVTKEENEYTMKVNLSCSDKTDYIMLHMGLDGTQFPSTSTARCEFVKNLDNVWAYGEWSNWSTKKIVEDLKQKGCVPKKSLILTFPSKEILSENLRYHFIRGYFDGDGGFGALVMGVWIGARCLA